MSAKGTNPLRSVWSEASFSDIRIDTEETATGFVGVQSQATFFSRPWAGFRRYGANSSPWTASSALANPLTVGNSCTRDRVGDAPDPSFRLDK